MEVTRHPDEAPAPVVASRLRQQASEIVHTWEQRVRAELETARKRETPVLIDDLPEVIERMATKLEANSLEAPLGDGFELSEEHGKQRAQLPSYSLEEVIFEYEVLHDIIIKALESDGPLDGDSRDLLARLIVRAIRSAASEFAQRRESALNAQLQETDIRFRHMVDAVKDYAIFTLDPRGYITSWNVGCVRMKRYTVAEAVGAHFCMLYPPEGNRREEPMSHLRTAAREGRFRGEGVRLRKGGEPFLADVSITPIYDDGKLTGFTKVVQDLTERNALIQERDLSRADSMQLRANAEYRKRFVEALTHDLRSPLAAAKTAADLIAKHSEDHDKVKTWSKRIADALGRGDRMIGDLLDAGRMEAGEPLKLEFQPCDMREIAEEICAELAGRHGDRFLVEVDGETKGVWNPEAVRRILDNLLANAVKYGEADAPITVALHRVADRLLVAVHNAGAISPVEDQERLFEPFHRTQAAETSGKPGWGIGLALVKGLTEAHGGVVKAESYPKMGTTFTVDLPMDARGKPPPQAIEEGPPNPDPPNPETSG